MNQFGLNRIKWIETIGTEMNLYSHLDTWDIFSFSLRFLCFESFQF